MGYVPYQLDFFNQQYHVSLLAVFDAALDTLQNALQIVFIVLLSGLNELL